MTEANATIYSQHFWNQTQVYVDRFTELLKTYEPDARSFLFASWESLDFHAGEWTDTIHSDLAEYEQIAEEAEQISEGNIGQSIAIDPADYELPEEKQVKVEIPKRKPIQLGGKK